VLFELGITPHEDQALFVRVETDKDPPLRVEGSVWKEGTLV